MLPAYKKEVLGVFVEKAELTVLKAGSNDNLLTEKVAEVLNNTGEDCLIIIPLINTIKNTKDANFTQKKVKSFRNALTTDFDYLIWNDLVLINAHIVPDCWSSKPIYEDGEITARKIQLPIRKFPELFVASNSNKVFLPKFLEDFFEQMNSVEYGVKNVEKQFPYVMEDYGGYTSPNYKYIIWKGSRDDFFFKTLPKSYQQDAINMKKERKLQKANTI